MGDGTRIGPGDWLAIIHFNRECFTNISKDPRQNARNALRFRRLIFSSFKQLAKDVNENRKFLHIKAFHGISWLPPHGEKLGFVIERVPDSMTNFIRKFYFTVLLKTFFPHLAMQENNRVEPHAYWLTRNTLLKNFSMEQPDNAFESNQQQSTGAIATNEPKIASANMQGVGA